MWEGSGRTGHSGGYPSRGGRSDFASSVPLGRTLVVKPSVHSSAGIVDGCAPSPSVNPGRGCAEGMAAETGTLASGRLIKLLGR